MTQPAPPESVAPPQEAASPGTIPDAPDADLTAAFKAGQLQLQAGQRVGVRDAATGQIGTVPAEEASKAVDAGAEIVSDKTLQQAVLEAKYGGFGGAAGAFGAGAARGFTLGLSDVAAAGLGGKEMQERLRAYQELHPVASVFGEVTGVALPAFLSGGGAAEVEAPGLLARGARAAGALNEGVTALGAGARAGIEGALASRVGTSLASRMLVRGAGAAAEGAVLGGAGGLASGISAEALREEDLGPPDQVAARLFASTAKGALLGGALGGTLGAAAEAGGDLVRGAAAKAHPILNKQAEESAFKSINARKKFTSIAEEIPGGSRAIGRQLLDDGVLAAGDTIDSLAPKIAAAKATAGEALESHVQTAIAQKTVPLGDVLSKLEKRASEFDGKLGYEAAANAMRRQKEELARIFLPGKAALEESAAKVGGAAAREGAEKIQVPLDALLQARRSLEGTINWQTEAIAGQGLKAAGRTLEDFVTEEADKLASARGAASGAWATQYKELKTAYRRYALADEAAQDTLERMHANAGHSLTDKLFAAHGMTGAALGLATGHPSALAGLAAGQASKFIRTRGSSIAAVAADKLATLGRIAETTNEVDANIARATKAFFSGKAPRGGWRTAGGDAVDVKQWQKAIAAYKANPGAATERALKAIAPVAGQAPNVTAAYGAQVKQALAYLATKLPEAPKPQASSPFATLPAMQSATGEQLGRMNPLDEDKFKRIVRAVTNPESVIEDFARGRISPDAVQAVKETNALLYEQMRTNVQTALTKHPERLTYNQKVGLGILFELAPDWSMTPEGIRTFQEGIAVNNQEESAKNAQVGAPAGGPGAGRGHSGAAAESLASAGMPGSERHLMQRGGPGGGPR